MAVDLSTLTDPSTPSIELYRSNDATPETFEALRFWITNELNRIQAMGVSTDEVVLQLAQAIESIADLDGGTVTVAGPQGQTGPQGPQGPVGATGPAGPSGDAGDLIDDSKIRVTLTWSSNKISTELQQRLRAVVDDPTPTLAGNLDIGSHGFIANMMAKEALSRGDLCYFDSVSRFAKADATDDETSRHMLAIALESMVEGQIGRFLLKGFFETTGLHAGDMLYVDILPGEWNNLPPDATGDIVRVIGYAITDTQLFFDPDKTWIEVA